MKKLFAAIFAAAALSAVLAAVPGQAVAHEGEDHTVAQSQNEQSSQQAQKVVYRYSAQPGDSYTLMARKAVQTYGKKYEVALSPAGIIYAETNMTREAGSPVLVQGQEVEINESTVKQWAEKAQKLSGAQKAAWGYYAQFADFNTDHVGEEAR